MREGAKPKKLRCAIYTRKSSEEGLEQDFNSLHAQREACEAYITSQRHEGWTIIPTAYDDGGYSGGSMERPGLRHLLEHIESKLVDVIVVYKVDRLTRSLTDFAKIVEVLDAQGVSFVSVTQQFNTTTSMGRLTLNVLLSFAQFEREVTGERIRDKIAASKKKGMWMGGWVPIGYDRKDRTLVVNDAEAETIRTIFRLYIDLKNVGLIPAELKRLQLTTKRYVTTSGRTFGGGPFGRGHIYYILSNPLYIGEINHKGTRHPGQHPAIIDRETWDAAQTRLRTNGHARRTRSNAKEPSMLAGLLFDEAGNKLIATHAVKAGKRYRYYGVQGSLRVPGPGGQRSPHRFAAFEIEQVVVHELARFLVDQNRVLEALAANASTPSDMACVIETAQTLASLLQGELPSACRETILNIVDRIVVAETQVTIHVRSRALLSQLLGEASNATLSGDSDHIITIETPIEFVRHTGHTKLIVAGRQDRGSMSSPDLALVKAVARGHVWFEDLVMGRATSIAGIATRENVSDRYVSQLIELAFISPIVVEAILDGRHALHLTTKRLTLGESLPDRWEDQINFIA